MKIIEINIKCFGKLRDFVLKPGEGVNIIYGRNESGKSTIMAFIKAMFYGLESGEKRRQYQPWSGGQPSGSIEFEHDGKGVTNTSPSARSTNDSKTRQPSWIPKRTTRFFPSFASRSAS